MSNLRIEELNLSVRARNALHRAGVETVAEAQQLSWAELMCLRGIGRGTAKEIWDAMRLLRPMTNADRIRSMTDEELARHLWRIASFDNSLGYCRDLPRCQKRMDANLLVPEEWCLACLLAWLQQPVKEG